MKSASNKLTLSILSALAFIALNNYSAKAQFWTEDFFTTNIQTNGVANGYVSTNGTWTETQLAGNTGGDANKFFISCTEAGMVAGSCAALCPTNAPPPPTPFIGQSLHIGSVPSAFAFLCPAGDCGAIYSAGDGGLGISDASTEVRAESPAINCTGKTSISLSFNYLENGDAASDNAQLWYYDGATWSILTDMPKTNCGDPANACSIQPCGGNTKGIWTNLASIVLPASANNNPNIKIGFRWVNDNDGVGTDPSFAVTHIQLSSSVTIGIAENTTNQNSSVFPNPGNGDLTIELNENMLNKTSMYIVYDAKGIEVKHGKLTTLKTNISLNDCANGLYAIRIQSGATYNVHRYLKQ